MNSDRFYIVLITYERGFIQQYETWDYDNLLNKLQMYQSKGCQILSQHKEDHRNWYVMYCPKGVEPWKK